MKKFTVILLSVFFTSAFAFTCFADYRTNMFNGKMAYKDGDYQKSLEYYEAAYREYPSEKLLAFINKLKEKVKKSEELIKLSDPYRDWSKAKCALTVNCLTLLISQAQASFTYAVSDNLSATLSGSYVWGPSVFSPYSDVSYGGGIDADYYLQNRAPNGLFGGMGFNVSYGTVTMPYFGTITSLAAVLNVHIGYRLIFGWGGVIEAVLGYPVAYLVMASDTSYVGGTGIKFGYAF